MRLEYIGADNQPHQPVMIHRAPLGSLERFVGVLIEHFAGAFPLWLAPEQVRVLTVSEKSEEYGRQVEEQLRAAGLRTTGDFRAEKLGSKIRDAQLELIPYMLVVGPRDAEAGTVSVRDRIAGDLGAMSLAAAIAKAAGRSGRQGSPASGRKEGHGPRRARRSARILTPASIQGEQVAHARQQNLVAMRLPKVYSRNRSYGRLDALRLAAARDLGPFSNWIGGEMVRHLQIVHCVATLATGMAWFAVAASAPAGEANVTSPANDTRRVSFNREVRPILSNHCFKCHGPAVQEAGLRFDRAKSAASVLDSGTRAIVPSDPAASEMLRRVTSTDPDLRMPPEGEAPPLSAAEIERLERWIAEGAGYERHWAYVPPVRPAPPRVRNEAWPRGDIDRFVLAQIEATALEPAPEANRRTLIRRVSLDLVGLPPTPAEVQAFVDDPAGDAYERLVDRLLASPQYGVRQALTWLDLARYADSDGYPHDRYRTVWPYRDWVVEAFNADMPFDQFTVEQIAGDLLPDADDRTRAASAFGRQTRINREAGVDPEEFRIEAVLDRVNTTATVWLGSTLGLRSATITNTTPSRSATSIDCWPSSTTAQSKPQSIRPA